MECTLQLRFLWWNKTLGQLGGTCYNWRENWYQGSQMDQQPRKLTDFSSIPTKLITDRQKEVYALKVWVLVQKSPWYYFTFTLGDIFQFLLVFLKYFLVLMEKWMLCWFFFNNLFSKYVLLNTCNYGKDLWWVQNTNLVT